MFVTAFDILLRAEMKSTDKQGIVGVENGCAQPQTANCGSRYVNLVYCS